MAQKPAALPALCSFSTQELLDEVERRSLGTLCVCVRVEEAGGGWGDAWHYRVKGSSIMLGAMSAAITLQLQRELEQRGRDNDQLHHEDAKV